LKIFEAVPFGESPNFGDALEDIRNPHFPVSKRHGLPHAEFPPVVPGEALAA
jgi:hypothetical protein